MKNYIYDTPQQIQNGLNVYSYTIVSYHRNNSNPNKKSRWTILDEEEIDCFLKAMSENWISDRFAWGLYLLDGQINKLGESPIKDDLKLAKFVKNADDWHGYPADYVKNIHDKPHSSVLSSWFACQIITKSEMSKIKQGKCNL